MKKISILVMVLGLLFAAFAACSDPVASSSKPSQNSSEYSTDKDSADSSSETASDDDSSTEKPTDSSEDSSSDSSEDSSSDSSEDSSSDSEEKEVYYTVQFDTDGGGDITAVSVLNGEKIEKPTDPSKTTTLCEYEFLGWFYNGEQWDFDNDVVTQDMTLTAQWKEGEKYTPPYLPKD